MQKLIALYESTFGNSPERLDVLPKAGSNRQYVRLHGNPTVIGVIGTDIRENHAFIHLAKHFESQGLHVPHIYAVDSDESCYLQQDLGKRSLYDAIAKGRKNNGTYSEEEVALLERTIRQLPHIQIKGGENLDFAQLMQATPFDKRYVLFDLHYFKYCFLKTTDVGYDECSLEDDFEHIAEDLTACCSKAPIFLYRDFQARNVMLSDNDEPYFIDFQGGKRGPLHYDVASFLWQASARYPERLRERLITAYISELRTITDVDADLFRHELRLFVLFRLLQVLGAYGLRGYVERKQYFLDSIPHAIANLRQLLDDGIAGPYPTLNSTLQAMVNLPRFCNGQCEDTAKTEAKAKANIKDSKALVVRVFSFSYKKGIPADTSGNGGGYVFDCRSTHNPGRYEPYKKITGLDAPVIDFLEENGEILTFLDSVYKLADFHCARYIERGFTDLMFSFGCTGGQHRSVYSAQHLAEHLNQKFGIEVHLEHREQGIKCIFPAKK